MPDYDFRGLSPVDFEILVRDLLQKDLDVVLESFKPGRDKGIDLRFSRDQGGSLIVQCKHYATTGYPGLLRQLRSDEKPKVDRLAPKRYILATSLGLSPAQKDEIKDTMAPYVGAPQDVYGRDDLNNLLARFPEVERHTFKLWLSSTVVLEEILHSKVKNLSRYVLQEMENKARLYVQNDSFQEAMGILDKHHVCIIAGIPGIGKTMLAEMLALDYAANGYEVVRVSGDISEAIALGTLGTRRVFYYDDFLGQTVLGDKFNKNEDQRLLDFIHAVRSSKTSRLILTTREYILNQARMSFERIDREDFRITTCVVDLASYTRSIRARILFNHLYFSDLPVAYREALLSDCAYLKIIDDRNYNPRIISFMTTFSRVRGISPAEYVAFFLSNLRNPLRVWEHAFRHHLTRSSRHLLAVLASMPSTVYLRDLEEAFCSYHRLEASRNNCAVDTQDFHLALKECEGNFVKTDQSPDGVIVQFHNPSVRDFIESLLAGNRSDLIRLVESATFFEQLIRLWAFPMERVGATTLADKPTPDCAHLFVSGVQRLVHARSCGLTGSGVSMGRVVRWQVREVSPEARTAHLLSVCGGLAGDDTARLLKEAVSGTLARIEAGDAEASDLPSLCEVALQCELVPTESRERLLNAAAEFLMSEPDASLEELEPICQLMELFPGRFNSSDRLNIAGLAEDFCDRLSHASGNDSADWLREQIDLLESIGKQLQVDFGRTVMELQRKVEEIEQDSPSERDDDGYWGGRSSNSLDCTDAEVESLFSMLIAVP